MKLKNLPSLIGFVFLGMLAFLAFNAFGLFNWVWNTDRHDSASTTGVAEVRVRPLDLPCKTRIDAVVPVKGEAKYTVETPLFSLDTNTDTIRMTAIGDVDTCFPATGAVVNQSNKNLEVRIDASQTIFNRPRVKPAATARSVDYQPGFGRTMVKFMPLVDFLLVRENGSKLTLEAQAFAQSVIGGSSCMKAAWPATKHAIKQTYLTEAKRKGITADHVQVTFTGNPEFAQNDMKHIPKAFGDTKFTVNNRDTVCRQVG